MVRGWRGCRVTGGGDGRILGRLRVSDYCLVYCGRPRNVFVSYIDGRIFTWTLKTFNSLVPLKCFYNVSFFYHLFIELVAHQLI